MTNKIIKYRHNNLVNINQYNSTPSNSNHEQWCQNIVIGNTIELMEHYQHICQKHAKKNKWVLMVNPKNSSLEALSLAGKINPEKILSINAKKVNVNFEHIKNTILKNTCAAIVISDTLFSESEINHLKQLAKHNQTQCVFVNKTSQPSMVKYGLH